MTEIPLTQGKVAIIDDHNIDLILRHTWCAHRHGKKFYAVTNYRNPETGKIISLYMHRLIKGVNDRFTLVDHRDNCGLNNQEHNLRSCTQAQNLANRGTTRISTSGFKGVTWDKARNKWKTAITSNGKMVNLGRFDNIEDAAKAWDTAAIIHHKEFAFLNFPLQSQTNLNHENQAT
jgi:hypothetical protein